jgi:2-hydroxychromene-2-carboxylate isomerase
MGAGDRTLRFYFDYISSNAYLAWHRLPDLERRFELAIEPVPVLFAGLLEAHGQLGPAEIPAKARWMWRDNLRKAARLGIPLEPPRFHPFNPLLPLRVSSLPLAARERRALIDALFHAQWAERRHLSEPGEVAAAASRAGLPGEALVARAQELESKQRLRQQTQDAIAAGVFGVPTLIVGGELFWGFDDLAHLELHLRGEDPIAGRELGASRLPASAVRRRFRDAPER